MIASAITGGDIVMQNAPVDMLAAVMEKLKESGVRFEQEDVGLRVTGPTRVSAVDVKTLPYPGFPTDLQAPITSLLTVAKGTSIITETIFEKRFAHVPELIRLGADIAIDGRSAVIKGTEGLLGAPVMSSDLRNSAALILAGLAAAGTTEVYRIYHLDRGYERIEQKLAGLGARIRRARQDD
jgi:UDP-N-acetylglucosamine 1-carboxyvinyltransferase